MKRYSVALTVPLLSVVAACSTPTTGDSNDSRHSSISETEVAAATEVAADPATLPEVVAALESLGYPCSSEGEFTFCVQEEEHWQIKEAPRGDGDRAFVQMICEQGLGSDGRVLTNGDVVIYSGNGHDLSIINTALQGQGVDDLEVIDHCPD